MLISLLPFLIDGQLGKVPMMTQPSALDQPGTQSAEIQRGFVDHAGEFDLTVGRYEERLPLENRIVTEKDGKTEELGISVARFKVLDSTRRSPGDTLDVVWIGPRVADLSKPPSIQPPVGQLYFLVTYPQTVSELRDVYAEYESNKGLMISRTLPAKSPAEELACTILMTDSQRLKPGATPLERLALSGADCLVPRDVLNRASAFRMRENAGYPGPPSDAYRGGGGRKPQPAAENAVTRTLREEAEGAPADVSVSLLELLNLWRVGSVSQRLMMESLAKCAKDKDAHLPGIDESWLGAASNGKLPSSRQLEEYIVKTLDQAVNLEIVVYLLGLTTADYSLEDDQQLVVWLDCPSVEIRYRVARHFSESRRRADLVPQTDYIMKDKHLARSRPPTSMLDAIYWDLDEKVAAWKEVFRKSAVSPP